MITDKELKKVVARAVRQAIRERLEPAIAEQVADIVVTNIVNDGELATMVWVRPPQGQRRMFMIRVSEMMRYRPSYRTEGTRK